LLLTRRADAPNRVILPWTDKMPKQATLRGEHKKGAGGQPYFQRHAPTPGRRYVLLERDLPYSKIKTEMLYTGQFCTP